MHYNGDWRRAINDLIRHIGLERTKILIRAARSGKLNSDQFFVAAGLSGVNGYPVGALWRHVKGIPQESGRYE